MATRTKTKAKPMKKPVQANDAVSAISTLILICEICLKGFKAAKKFERQRWFFKTVAAILGWAREHGYPNGKNRAKNPFIADRDHMGELTVRQLMEVVAEHKEFPKGLDTVIRIGDVEGNNGVNGNICLTSHKKGDVVLSIDPHAGDLSYGV